jgi:hypothetical protein
VSISRGKLIITDFRQCSVLVNETDEPAESFFSSIQLCGHVRALLNNFGI